MSTGTLPDTPTNVQVAEIPGEPGVFFCARHKNIKTRLRCGRCEAPICPKCTTFGPTGARCKQCVSNRNSHIYQISPLQYFITFVIAFIGTLAGIYLMSVIPFMAILYALVAGNLIAKAIVKATQGKRGTPLAVTASIGVAAGLLPAIALSAGSLLVGSLFIPMLLFYGALTIVGLWNWLR